MISRSSQYGLQMGEFYFRSRSGEHVTIARFYMDMREDRVVLEVGTSTLEELAKTTGVTRVLPYEQGLETVSDHLSKIRGSKKVNVVSRKPATPETTA